MRSGPIIPIPFLLLALAALADGARAGEMFVCPDKTVLYVTADTRAQLSGHPCVRAHYAKTNASAEPPRQPTSAPVASLASAVTTGAATPSGETNMKPASADTANTKTEIKTTRFGRRN